LTNMSATTDIATESDFRRLVVHRDDETLVRLEDIARIELGSESYDALSWYNGTPAVFVAIEPAPGSNPLTVARHVRDEIKEIKARLPAVLTVTVGYDASVYIEDSIKEVFITLLEALFIVLLVIYLSLGSVRAAIVPALAVPLSLVGGAFLMLLMGFSINLLTLLALVLAIGLVVDRPRNWHADHCHDDDVGRGLCTDRFHGRAGRYIVYGVRICACRRRAGVRRRRIDAVANVVRQSTAS
jgi:multidrug efflux pump